MAYYNGLQNAFSAAALRWLAKYGPVGNTGLRYQVDDAEPNNWIQFADNAAGTAKIHYLIGANTGNQTAFVNPYGVAAYSLRLIPLQIPVAPTITHAGTAGAATWTYVVVAINGSGLTLGHSAASSGGSTTSGNATLSATNYNIITWPAVTGAASYDIYRTAVGSSPSTTGFIANVPATISATTGIQTTTYTLNDTGLAGDGSTAPTTNTTGVLFTGATDVVTNFVSVETGANNAIAGTYTGATLTSGMRVGVLLAHTLQAGANTFNLAGGGAVAIKSSRNTANNIATGYAVGGVINMLYNGTAWLDLSQ